MFRERHEFLVTSCVSDAEDHNAFVINPFWDSFKNTRCQKQSLNQKKTKFYDMEIVILVSRENAAGWHKDKFGTCIVLHDNCIWFHSCRFQLLDCHGSASGRMINHEGRHNSQRSSPVHSVTRPLHHRDISMCCKNQSTIEWDLIFSKIMHSQSYSSTLQLLWEVFCYYNSSYYRRVFPTDTSLCLLQ